MERTEPYGPQDPAEPFRAHLSALQAYSVRMSGQRPDQTAQDAAGLMCAKTGVWPAAKADMGVGRALQSEHVGGLEDRRITVSRRPAERQAPARRNISLASLRPLGTDTADMRQGREETDDFLDRETDTQAIACNGEERVATCSEGCDQEGRRMNERIAPACKVRFVMPRISSSLSAAPSRRARTSMAKMSASSGAVRARAICARR